MGHKADFADRVLVLLHVLVAFRRALLLVERHTRRDNVEHYSSLVRDRRLEHSQQLLLITRERAANEGRAQLYSQGAGIDGWKVIDDSGLQLRAQIGCRGEL